MNTPSPSASPQPQVPKPKLVVSGVSRRDVIIGILIAVGVVAFIVAAVFYSSRPPRNLLTGVIKSHHSTGERETLLTVSTKGVTEKTADTGYSLKVWVESDQREYEVMVEKEIWDKKKDGDTIEFLRPPSEQR
jgi:predicted membrane channel-forming protein YqfA (hemolysin III family)